DQRRVTAQRAPPAAAEMAEGTGAMNRVSSLLNRGLARSPAEFRGEPGTGAMNRVSSLLNQGLAR
ncbi:MAG: hypothetical protein ACK557_08300, partial [Planctomycetota bacterium]